MLVWYKQGIADNAFIVQYLGSGGTNLFFQHGTLEVPTTLRELLKLPMEHRKINEKRSAQTVGSGLQGSQEDDS